MASGEEADAGAAPESFADFVVRQQHSLLRLAYLLAGDRGHAEDLVQSALMTTYRHWDRVVRRGDPSAYVRRALVTTHTSWRRRAWHREQPTGRLPDVEAAGHGDRLDRDEELGRALADLPPRMRATVVLRYYEDLSELQTAQLMGCSESTVNTQAARGLARLRGALARSPVDTAGSAPARRPPGASPMNPDKELRDRLRRLADRAGHPSTDGTGLARSVAGRADERRRRQHTVLAAAGCVVLLGIAVPQVVDRGPQQAEPASGAVAGVTSGAGAVPPVVDVFAGPTRGSLAGDQAFLDGVRGLPWTEEPPVRAADGTILYYLPEPPVDSRRVVFAGDVPGGRWALVVGWTTDTPAEAAALPPGVVPTDALAAAWFTGPPGASAEQMAPAVGPNSVANDWPVALTDPRTGALVVVAAPGDEVQVSHRPLIDEEGTTSRQWRQVETEDGVAVTQTAPFPRSFDASTSFRVLRDGRIEARDAPWSLYAEDLGEELPIEYPRGRPDELGELAARSAAENVVRELGLPGSEVRITAQWVGSVPAGEPGRAAVVTVTLPSGAIVVEAQWLLPEQADDSFSGTFCGRGVLPAGPPAERRVQAVSCEVVDQTTGAPMSTSLVVVGPPEVALVRTYDADRAFLTEHSTVGGVLVVPMPLGTDSVEAVTDGGVTLGRIDVLGRTVDFGD